MSIWSSLRRRVPCPWWLLNSNGLRRRVLEIESMVREMRAEVAALHRLEMSRAWVAGHRMRVNPDDTVVSQRLRELGWFEPLETRLIQRLVKPGDTVVDVGANIGYYTLQLASMVGDAGRVFAFEPDPRNFDLLRRNVWQNGYRNVTLVQAAVAARPERLKLYLNPENHGDHRIYAGAGGRDAVDVEAVSLDDYFGGRVDQLDLVKLDVQGAEGAALAGMTALVAAGRIGRVVAEFWPRGLLQAGYDPREFLEARLREGFHVRVIDEETERVLPLDVADLLERLPVAQDTDWLFTNLLLEHGSVEPVAFEAGRAAA
jgi:FkbM family methyltransferase